MNRVMVMLGLGAVVLGGCFKVVKPVDPAGAAPEAGAFPHAILDAVQQAIVTPEGRVDYKGLQTDRDQLDAYVGFLAITSPERDPEAFPTSDDALAYYINAYNALAMMGVIDRPGLASVVDEKVDYFYFTRYKLGKKNVSLYTLENGIVRPTFDDPRVHFALNCQSVGCPRLPQEAFFPDRLEEQLDALTVEFVTDPTKVTVEDGTVRISQIFEWYAQDFEAAGGAVAYINQYRDDDLPTDAPLEYIPYDWELIAQEGRGP